MRFYGSGGDFRRVVSRMVWIIGRAVLVLRLDALITTPVQWLGSLVSRVWNRLRRCCRLDSECLGPWVRTSLVGVLGSSTMLGCGINYLMNVSVGEFGYGDLCKLQTQ